MRKHQIVGLALVVTFSLVALAAQANTYFSFQGSSGHPYNNLTWSNYSIGDTNASVPPSSAWAVPIPLPEGSSGTTYQTKGYWLGSCSSVSAIVFDISGNVYSYNTLNTGPYTAVSVSARYSAFVRVTASSLGTCAIYSISGYY